MSELKDIMEKRRRKAEQNQRHTEDDEMSLSELEATASTPGAGGSKSYGGSSSHFHGSSRRSWDPQTSSGSAGMMSPDLAAAMERRRKLADSASELPKIDTGDSSPLSPAAGSPLSKTDASASPAKQELKAVGMGADLQAIMERRRRLAGEDVSEAREAQRSDQVESSNQKQASKRSAHRNKLSTKSEHSVDSKSSRTDVASPTKASRRSKTKGSTVVVSSDEQSVDASAASHSGSSDEIKKTSSRGKVTEGAASPVKKRKKKTTRKTGGNSSGEEKPSEPKSGKGAEVSSSRPPVSPTKSSRFKSSSKPKSTSSGEEDAPRKPVRRSKSKDVSSDATKPRRTRATRGMNDDIIRPGASEGEVKPENLAFESDETPKWDQGFPAFTDGSAAGTAGTGNAGDVDLAFVSGAFDNTDDAFGNAFASSFPVQASSTSDAFGTFDDAGAFGSSVDATQKTLGREDFDETFSPSAFDPGNTFGGGKNFNSAFGQQSEEIFGNKKSAKTWDSTPHVGRMPKRTVDSLTLSCKPILQADFTVPPVVNPLNRNLIFCDKKKTGIFLRELDPTRGNVQVSCVPILTSDFKKKIADKYKASAHRIDQIISLAAGVHHANGQARVRVAAILDIDVLESAQILRILAVWQWGYGSPNPVSLQYAIIPPSSLEFIFDSTSLQIADGLLFLAGASPVKGPCLFMCKPSVKETWSANFLGASGRISSMAVTTGPTRVFPYLAIALDGGSLSVWTYESALSGPHQKDSSSSSGPAKRWLFPLCQLDHSSWVEMANVDDKNGLGFCSQMEWLSPRHIESSQVLLAAAFQGGLAVFHVDVRSSQAGGAALQQVPMISPVGAKYYGLYERVSASWIDMGPQQVFCLGVLLLKKGDAKICFESVKVPSRHNPAAPSSTPLLFHTVASTSLDTGLNHLPARLICGREALTLFGGSTKHIVRMSLNSGGKNGGSVRAIFRPIVSSPNGLSATGEPLSIDQSHGGDVLHIVNVTAFERKVSKMDGLVHERSILTQRRWLVQTSPGDSKHTALRPDVDSAKSNERSFGGDVDVLGGGVSKVVCSIDAESIEGMIPLRIERSVSGSMCAVLLTESFYGSSDAQVPASINATAVAVIDLSGVENSAGPSLNVIEARDISFLPTRNQQYGFLLGKNGSQVSFFRWNASKLQELAVWRPILGVEVGPGFLECTRFFCFVGAGKVSFAAIGTQIEGNKCCFVLGDLADTESVSPESMPSFLPNIETDRKCWLEYGEEVFSCIGLECDSSGYRNFAIATSKRVVILSSALQVVAQVEPSGPISNMAPLGPFAVCYTCLRKVWYLCCLDAELCTGAISSLPRRNDGSDQMELAYVRPDRIIVLEHHARMKTVEPGQSAHSFQLAAATTYPALLLEPLLAGAVCLGGKSGASTALIRMIVEKYGRKTASLTHGDGEGIGQLGSGITPRVFEILNRYEQTQASSWLLTGSAPFTRGASSVVLPPWLPISPKAPNVVGTDAFLHAISHGDQYLMDYLKSPDSNMPVPLPKKSAASSYVCVEHATGALRNGRADDALKVLDLAGSEESESTFVQLALALSREKDATALFRTISGYNDAFSGQHARAKAPTSIAALAACMKQNAQKNEFMSHEQIIRWVQPLAPSLQRSCRGPRLRQKAIGESDLNVAFETHEPAGDSLWNAPCNEAKHVWNEGALKEKEHMLSLDRLEGWIGCRRPVILGKAGVSAALDRGEKTLADLLNQDDDSFGGKSDIESEGDNWVEGVGEGRSDEANLVAYFRFSEGDDEDSPWKSEGLHDITTYQNNAKVIGDSGTFSLQPSTSSVDEGESGKVKSLYDLVFEKSGASRASGLAISASRGSSMDVGMLLGPEHSARKRCTIEFWYFLPSAPEVTSEIVLARRTCGDSGDDLARMCMASETDNILWDLCLLPSGEVEFRSGSGIKVSSNNAGDETTETDNPRDGFAAFSKWNHVAVVFSSRDLAVTDTHVSIYMKGIEVGSAKVSLLPPSHVEDDLDDTTILNDLMQKSHVLFGLNHCMEFRMTELRIWACARSADDTQTFLYEYLSAAESKKKFKVKISQKKSGRGSMLAPPKGASGGPSRGFLATTKSSMIPSSFGAKAVTAFSLAPTDQTPADTTSSSISSSFETAFDSSFNQQPVEEPRIGSNQSVLDRAIQQSTIPEEEEVEGQPSLWDTALPLSKQVRPSAAAALIRGPPATRHFGGNRGGLPDFSGMDRFGVGGIAICGSEKTIVWRDNEDPPALTYPIGASGAIVSDQMDDMGSEFMCCFLAKEKRMVVFELQSRTVVVELQMTTKLNFWRYLPPEAAENTLCFILITPVGGFHWMPLEESPRPHQVWKRGPSLQGKKVVNYEEGGSNGLDGPEVRSRVGLVMVTNAAAGSVLESWLIPVAGDSKAVQLPGNILGACFCQPPFADTGAFLPLIVAVHEEESDSSMVVNVISVEEPEGGCLSLGNVEVTQAIDLDDSGDERYDPPALAMGTLPEVICCSLSNILVIIIRRRGLIAAFELEDDNLSLIAQEGVGHFVVDAVMRYSAEVGGAEIVMLLSDNDNPKDGRIVSFCFRSAA